MNGLCSSGRQTIINSRRRARARADVAHARDRVREEHGPEAREGEVELGLELSVCASASSKETLARPARRASARPISRIVATQSVPTAEPPGPTSRASCSVVSPKPQPMSSARMPGCRPARSSGPRLWASPIVTNMVRKRRNCFSRTSFQNWMCSALGAVSTLMRPSYGRPMRWFYRFHTAALPYFRRCAGRSARGCARVRARSRARGRAAAPS